MENWNLVLGIYQSPHIAKGVLKKLKVNGFYRSASITHTHDGQLQTEAFHPPIFPISCFLALIVFLFLVFFSVSPLFIILIPLVIILLGLLLCNQFYLPLIKGIDSKIIEQFKPVVIADETFVIVQSKWHEGAKVVDIMREVESWHPITFIFRSEVGESSSEVEDKQPKEPLTQEQLQAHAIELANSLGEVSAKHAKGQSLLNRLSISGTILELIRYNVAEIEHVEKTTSLPAEWLLDNSHVIRGNIEEVQKSLPQKYYNSLPKVKGGPSKGLPRIYLIAKDLIECTANKLNRDNIFAYLQSFQTIEPLSIGELWAFPLMLRVKLIESLQSLAIKIDRRLREDELARFWGNRLLYVSRRQPEKLSEFLAILEKENPNPSPHFAEEVFDHLFDEETILPLVRKWFEEKCDETIATILHDDQMEKAAEEVDFSSAITSLITLSQLAWRDLFEALCPVDILFKDDPVGVYANMDFTTRDTYRHSIEKVARLARRSETDVVNVVLQLAKKGKDTVSRHVGYYLIDKGRPLLETKVICFPTLLQRFRRLLILHPTPIYLGTIGLMVLVTELIIAYITLSWGITFSHTVLFSILSIIPLAEIAIQITNLLLSQILPPFVLPKMSYAKAIPDAYKTLVVIPTKFTTPQSIIEHIHHLEIHYLANPDPKLLFSIFSDFMDSPEQNMKTDDDLLNVAIKEVENLENKYGPGKFFLFHRQRVWSNSEQAWIGWERKRGKLECLNRYLLNDSPPEDILKVGQKSALNDIKYVITLDADTQLPKDKAKELIETLAHPLNEPVFSSSGTIERGYTIIQPRVGTNYVYANSSLFARIFSDSTCVNPYTQAVSEIYQDLMHEGTYHGKGIYDVKGFHQILREAFPEERLLSHDLIEGAFVRVGYASDIALFDLFPKNYQQWSKRLHRWIRGDWQIIEWIFPKVNDATKQKRDNPLSIINRWKIFDNLRRSLMPVTILFLLVTAWLFSLEATLWTLLVVIVFFTPAVLNFIWNAFKHFSALKLVFNEFERDILRNVLTISLLPQQALLAFDAIVRALYRRFISHRHLLEWQTNHEDSPRVHARFILNFLWVSLFAVLVYVATLYLNPDALPAATPFCFLWLLSPLIVSWLDKPRVRDTLKLLTTEDRLLLRETALKTWRYFDDFVGPQTHWLPPDNYQAALSIEVAQRTSPTNIGLWLLSAVSAYDFYYLTIDELLDRISPTFETFEKLERHEGHLLNWYDTQTLKPLYPRFVSTVDSGNLIASLWTLEHSIKQILTASLLPFSFLEGARDIFDQLYKETDDPEARKKFQPLQNLLLKDSHDISERIDIVKSTLGIIQEFISQGHHNYWLLKLEKRLQQWKIIIERYFSWIEVLKEIPDNELNAIDESAVVWKNELLQFCPSLDCLSSAQFPPAMHHFMKMLQKKTLTPESVTWIKKLNEAIQTSQWLAGEKKGEIQRLLDEVYRVADMMNMQFLYNKDRKLFRIGFHVDDMRMDGSYYDLLASEARISSLVSIAKGDVPVEHWWALGRPYRYIYGRQALISWGGTMFEYLMPLLFNKYYPETLIGDGCDAAVACQISYAKQLGIPWGISEAAFSEIDTRKTYQYRSFGVPGLGFKRGLETDLVISPYSTALALMIDPLKAVKNLKTLRRRSLNLLGPYGYYESIDFTRARTPHGERGIITYAFMAHHQGMALLAINNLLHSEIMPSRFHADPRVAGVEALLYERIPLHPPIGKGTRSEIPISRLTPISPMPILGVLNTPHTITPKVNLLSNKQSALMITNGGGGYSHWKEFDITRWRADATSDSWGSYFYIKDLQSGNFWSIAYQPTLVESNQYTVIFKSDKVEFRRKDFDIETLTEIAIAPEDDVEIRLITLANLSRQTRELELTSYVELALAPHRADSSHPAFNKLFIETEALPEMNGLLAFRRLRSTEDLPIWAGHIIAKSEPSSERFQFETDRASFIGRGHDLQHPKALDENLTNTAGTVLDPIFSLRTKIVLNPGQRIQVAFVTVISDNRQTSLELLKKYSDLVSCHRAFELAWSHAQLELRHLRIHQEEAQLFQKFASRILYPQEQLRASAERISKNRAKQPNLWAYGISGDLPIVVVAIEEFNEIEVVKQTIIAHAFWRLRGLKVDLVILCQEAAGYEQPLFERLKRIIQSHSNLSDIDKPGGIFLRNCSNMPEEDLTLFAFVARVFIVAARGSLRQQLILPMKTIAYPPDLATKHTVQEEPSRPLPFLELPYFNGLGGFTPDGKQYVIYLGPHDSTPAPWINVIANEQFGTLVSETGLGSTWFGNSQTNRLTPWSNDPLTNPISDAIYIRDEELGTFWSPTPGPIRELDAYRIRHGQGYTFFEHNSHNISQELLIFVPFEESKTIPIRVQKLRLVNNSDHRRTLSVFSYSEWVLGPIKEETQMYVITGWDPESQALFAYNRYHTDFGDYVAFTSSARLPTSYTCDRREFLGRNNTTSNPDALKRTELSGKTGPALDPCAALQVRIELEPGEEKEVVFIMGYAPDEETARKLMGSARNVNWVNEAFAKTKSYWDHLLGTVQVETPELYLNFSMNRWLLYQTLSCRIWGRSAFYQSSGAYGFRDQLQDVMALTYTDSRIAREQILRAAGRQFIEGDVQHWWLPPGNSGVRTRISDDLLWLPFVTAHYVRITKDLSILQEVIPFIKGELLKEDEHEAFFVPEISNESGTLLEHCRRAIHKGLTIGPHGLPLIGSGDWNDGMNLVGIHGKGESVWLGWFLIQVLKDSAELLSEMGQKSDAEGLCAQATRIKEAIEATSWDGNWYIRAYFDDGTPLGSKINEEDSIDSLAQSWGVICGAANPERALEALKSVDNYLVKEQDKLVLLLAPAFDKTPLDPGYIKGYPPGVRENGGQYTHGSLWVALAFARQGNGDRAANLLRMMHPIFHTQTLEGVHKYKTEPYVLTGDVYYFKSHLGRGGWSWYSGSSGWMYRIWLEEILGFKLRGDILEISPRLPSQWDKLKIQYWHKKTLHIISIENPGRVSRGKLHIQFDNKVIEGNQIPLVNDGITHNITIKIE